MKLLKAALLFFVLVLLSCNWGVQFEGGRSYDIHEYAEDSTGFSSDSLWIRDSLRVKPIKVDPVITNRYKSWFIDEKAEEDSLLGR
ncbi:MAG: hypothetical protein AAF487_10435 [Bacteroidota bacterium]